MSLATFPMNESEKRGSNLSPVASLTPPPCASGEDKVWMMFIISSGVSKRQRVSRTFRIQPFPRSGEKEVVKYSQVQDPKENEILGETDEKSLNCEPHLRLCHVWDASGRDSTYS